MPDDIDARIARVLDQLENPNLSEGQISRLQKRLEILQSEREAQ